MKDYLKKAIEQGKAIDAYKNPHEVEKYVREKIGWMQFSDIEDVIKKFVSLARENGVVFWGDLSMWIYKWQMEQLPHYLKGIVTNFEKELKTLLDKASKPSEV